MRRPDAGAPHKSLCRNSSVPGLELGAGGLTQLKSFTAGEPSTKRGRGLTWILGKVEREGRRDDAKPLQSEDVTVRISRLRLGRDDEPEATCHGQRLPTRRVSDVAVLEGLIEPPTASASEEPIMSTAPTASMGLLTSSRQQPHRGDDIGSLCRIVNLQAIELIRRVADDAELRGIHEPTKSSSPRGSWRRSNAPSQ